MADLINFTLPELKSNELDNKTIKQIKNYLFQLTEQLKFQLNSIDTDNFTDDYKKELSQMIDSATTNSQNTNVENFIAKYKEYFKRQIEDAAKLISGNKGGYIVLADSDEDTFPDEILIMDTSDIATAQKIWRWNKNGLMFQNKATGSPAEIAITMDGAINANMITTGILKGIRVEAAEGSIGGWDITADSIKTTWTTPSADGKSQIELTLSLNCAKSNNDNIIELKSSDALSYYFRIRRDGTADFNDVGVNNLTVKGKLDVIGNVNFQTTHNVLWSGAYYMSASHEITLSKNLQDCANGIILVFSAYPSELRDYNFYTFHVPKHLTLLNKEGGGLPFIMVDGMFKTWCRKYLYIRDNRIFGNDDNKLSGTANGIPYNNKLFVLREVLEY